MAAGQRAGARGAAGPAYGVSAAASRFASGGPACQKLCAHAPKYTNRHQSTRPLFLEAESRRHVQPLCRRRCVRQVLGEPLSPGISPVYAGGLGETSAGFRLGRFAAGQRFLAYGAGLERDSAAGLSGPSGQGGAGQAPQTGGRASHRPERGVLRCGDPILSGHSRLCFQNGWVCGKGGMPCDGRQPGESDKGTARHPV